MRFAEKSSTRKNTSNVLALVAKAPVIGGGKARLASPDFGEERIAQITSAFLADTAALLIHPLLPARVVLSLDGDPATLPLSLQSLPVMPQADGDLGERLSHLFATQFAIPGTRNVCAIGGDTPHLPLAFLIEAFARLASPDTDVVLGPSDNGGYYLVGMNHMVPELFHDIPWSSLNVLTALQERARSAGVRVALLPPWYDIDIPADLIKLQEDISRKTVTATGTAAVLGL